MSGLHLAQLDPEPRAELLHAVWLGAELLACATEAEARKRARDWAIKNPGRPAYVLASIAEPLAAMSVEER